MRNSQEKRPGGATRSGEGVREEGSRWPTSAGLSRCQPERGSKGCWDAEELDRDGPSCWKTRIASQPLRPRETRVRPLRTGQDHVRCARPRGDGWRQAPLEAVVSHELHAGAPVLSAAPISPEQRCGTHPQRMQQDTDLARLRCGAAIPLTLLTQRTRAATANAGRIHHAQAAIGFPAPLLGRQRLPCWTAERPVGLERKVLARKAPCFPGGSRGRRAIPSCGNG
jgi:hypothetical protein